MLLAAAATGERILDAAVAVFWQRPVDDIPLEEVARRAGVSLQTVIRRFEGKQGLLAAAAERETERVRRQRDQAPSATCRERCATCSTTTRNSGRGWLTDRCRSGLS
jgi:AcrR family transcriptional regulator